MDSLPKDLEEFFFITPIVGEITANGVVFLITAKKNITLYLKIDDLLYSQYVINAGPPTRIFVDVPPNTTNTKYLFYHQEYYIEREVSVHNLKAQVDKLVFVSCDMPSAETKKPLWNKVSTDEKQGLCIHIGDNIYGDPAYKSSKHDYNSIYHKTWARWSLLTTNFSHLMVADDHEITDGYDYTSTVPPTDPAVSAGMLAYQNFQLSLTEQPQNPIGYIVKQVDADTTVYIMSRTLMGTTVLAKIKELKSTFSGKVILAMSSAPVPLSVGLMGTIYTGIFGSTGWDDAELTELYNLCFELLESGQVSQFVLVGGDFHFGIDGTVSKNNNSINIYVASAISSHPTVIESFCASAINGHNTFNGYQLDFKSKATRNYLTVDLPLKPTNPGKLVYSEKSMPKDLIAYYKELFAMI